MISPFKTIQQEAELLKGADFVEARLSRVKSDQALSSIPDNEYLSLMSRRIFRAGIKHSVVDAKWLAFEEVFYDFDVDSVCMMSDEELEKLMSERRIIRHWRKINSVRLNAMAIQQLRDEYGCFGAYIAHYPSTRIIDLWGNLSLRFKQLGGISGACFLRMAGKDTFILYQDVVRALNRWGAIEGDAKSKSARLKVQEAFNRWMDESGKDLCQISMILALSID